MRSWVGILIASTVGCHNWDPDAALPCREGGECDDGFTCLAEQVEEFSKCVRDKSQGEGKTCDENIQCEGELRCAGFQCRAQCDLFYSTSDCAADYVCEPLEAEGQSGKQGFCVKSECAPGAPCKGGLSCIKIKLNAFACLQGCEITWAPDYTDTCGSNSANPRYCQPLGMENTLVCLDVGPSGQGIGDPCEPINQPCEPGLTCHDSGSGVGYICRELCQAGQSNPNNCNDTGIATSVCCTARSPNCSEPRQYGVCMPTSPGCDCL